MERCDAQLAADPSAAKGHWAELFGRSSPIYVEIGCGKGGFIVKTALANPDISYVAVEKVKEALVMAMEKAALLGLSNILFISGDAASLADFFAPGEVSRIYINFCDPWPKNGHAKRRLTHENFLHIYKQILAPGGQLHFKTDNRALFDFSTESFSAFGLELIQVCYDLQHSDIPNITSEYEEKFTAEGIPICHAQAVFPSSDRRAVPCDTE